MSLFSAGIRADGTRISFLRRWLSLIDSNTWWPTDEEPYRLYAEMQECVRLDGHMPPYELIEIRHGSEEASRRMRVRLFLNELAQGRHRCLDEQPTGRERPRRAGDWWAAWLDGGRPTERYSTKGSDPGMGGCMVLAIGFAVLAFCAAILFGSSL